MTDDNYHAKGPVVLWIDYGVEGWQPRSYPSVLEALKSDRYGSKFVITKVVDIVTGVDFGKEDRCAMIEVERLPDGSIRILNWKEY